MLQKDLMHTQAAEGVARWLCWRSCLYAVVDCQYRPLQAQCLAGSGSMEVQSLPWSLCSNPTPAWNEMDAVATPPHRLACPGFKHWEQLSAIRLSGC